MFACVRVCALTHTCVCACTQVSVSVTGHVSVFFCSHCIRLHSEYAREREGAREKQCVKVCMCTCNAACIACVHETLPVFTAHTHISRCSLATALARACQALHHHPQAPTCRSLCTQQLCSAFALSLVTEKARRAPDNMRVYVCMWSQSTIRPPAVSQQQQKAGDSQARQQHSSPHNLTSSVRLRFFSSSSLFKRSSRST